MNQTILLTICACLIYAINSGIRGNYGVILGPISENSGIDYASISFVLAVAQLSFGIMQPVFGVVSMKKSNVFVLRSGIVLVLCGLFLLPMCKSIVLLMIALGIMIPSGTAALSYGIIMGTITPLLSPKAASTVSGIVSASAGIGSTVFAPCLQAITAMAGLIGATMFLGAPALILLPVTFYIGKLSADMQAQKSQALSGAQTTKASDASQASFDAQANPAAAHDSNNISLAAMFKNAIQNHDYIRLMMGFFTCGFHMAIIETHLYTQITTFGFSKQTAAFAFSIYGIATMVGSVNSGMLCSRFPMKNVLGTLYASRIVWIVAFLLLPKNIITVYAFAICLGLTGGATVPPTSGITGHLFGAKKLSTLFGIVFFCHQVGSFFSAWFGGICVTATGGYTLIWLADAVLCVMAATVSYRITDK